MSIERKGHARWFGLVPLYQLVLIVASVGSPGLQAQSVESRAQTLEEVVVTSSKREEGLLDSPYAVSAFSQESLNREGVKNLADLGALVPSLQIGQSPTDSGVQLAIRGITSNNFTELGDPAVAFHFDGLYSPRPQAGLALLHDVERVEINRGPQGTLFGRNSSAGSINVISARPEFDEKTANLNFERGERNQYTAKGWFNLPLSDSIALRASFLWDRADSFLDQVADYYDFSFDGNQNGSFDDVGDVPLDGIPNVDQRRNREVGPGEFYQAIDRFAYRVGVRWQPNDSLEWNLVYDYFEDHSPGGLLIKDCEKADLTRGHASFDISCDDQSEFHAPVNVPGELDMTIKSWRSILEFQLTDSIVMEHRFAFAEQSRHQLFDDDASYPDPNDPALGITYWPPEEGFVHLYQGELERLLGTDSEFLDTVRPIFEDKQLETVFSFYESIVTELQFKSTHDEPLQWIAGFFYLEEDNNIRFDVEQPFVGGRVHPYAGSFVQPERGAESMAVFAQFDYQWNEELNLTAGARYTEDEKFDVGGRNHGDGYGYNYGAGPATQSFYDQNSNAFIHSFSRVGRAGDPNDPTNPNPPIRQSDTLTRLFGTLNPGFLDRVPGSVNTYSDTWDQLTWKLGFDYRWDEDTFVYGSIATGYKAGGFGDRFDLCDCGFILDTPYDQEEVLTYELGVKAQFPDNDLTVLANVFFSDFTDMQQTAYTEFTSEGPWLIPDGFTPNEGVTVVPAGNGDCPADATNGCVTVGRSIGGLLTTSLAGSEIFGIEIEFDWRPYENGRFLAG